MIEADKLTKYYGALAAVKDVSFRLRKGEILGFLGPNGAGKSTTMRILATFLYPTSGTAVVNGFDILKDPLKVRESVGYLPENAPLYEEMAVKDFLSFVAHARRVKDVPGAVDRVLKQCFIEDVANQPIYTLSKGYRQRVCFAQAIIHDPAILILDEPTVGLDPNQKTQVRKMISEMGANKAILLSTHILDEAMAICNRAIIISQGEVRVDDTPQNLARQAAGHGTVHLEIRAGGADLSSLKQAFGLIRHVSAVEAEKKGEAWAVRISPQKGQDVSGPVLSCTRDKKWEIVSVAVDEGRLEDVFRMYTA